MKMAENIFYMWIKYSSFSVQRVNHFGILMTIARLPKYYMHYQFLTFVNPTVALNVELQDFCLYCNV